MQMQKVCGTMLARPLRECKAPRNMQMARPLWECKAPRTMQMQNVLKTVPRSTRKQQRWAKQLPRARKMWLPEVCLWWKLRRKPKHTLAPLRN